MNRIWLVVLFAAMLGRAQAADWDGNANQPVVQVDYANPGLNPSQWTLIVHPDGSGHFRSQANASAEGERKVIDLPSVDRDVQLSPAYAQQLFDAAKKHKWFNEQCESHMKVAFQGWKTLTYSGPEGKGTCTYNYSKNKELQDLSDSLQATALTILEGERIQILLQHDRLGLDAELEFLSTAAHDGRAQQIDSIKAILERLTTDEEVLDRVRRRARDLLARAGT